MEPRHATAPLANLVSQWRSSTRSAATVLSSTDGRWAPVSTSVTALVAGPIAWLAATRVRSRLWAVALGLLLGGVLGNLTDRMFRAPGFPVGHVVDFINTPWMMPAIYNVADIFIVSMMIAVALLVLVGPHLDGTRPRKDADGTVDSGPGEPAAGAEPEASGTSGSTKD